MALQPRRSARAPEPRRFLAAEQAWRQQQDQEHVERTRAIQLVTEQEELSDSTEHDLRSSEGSSSEDEHKARRGDENTAQWSRDLHDMSHAVYNDPPKVLLEHKRGRNELDFLQCFLDKELIDTFVTNTNATATLRQAPLWVEVDSLDMWRYLAIRIRQGIVVLPRMRYYWHADYRDVYVTQLMTRDRFEQLHRYFHISPPVPRGQRQTVIEKTAPFYHQCQTLFHKYYQPGRDFAIDETMIRFQGRSFWITIIKGKPTPMGYKIFTVASDGYLLGFRIFRGKGGYDTRQSVLHHTVVKLVKPWGGVNRRLYFDNLYTSPTLCDHLLRMKIRSCGTCRPNRASLPPGIKQIRASLGKGETHTWQRGQLGCLLWNDSKPVIFLSTHHRVDSMQAIPPVHGRPASTRPTVAVDYNLNKGHVDKVDQLRSYYVVERRTRRTWPALAWWLLDMCIGNAYKLWCLEYNQQPGMLQFREQLLKQIAAACPSQHTGVQPDVPAAVHMGFVGHWPVHHPEERDCVHCSRGRKRRRKTVGGCKVCGVRLHPYECFEAYHDRLEIDNRTV